MTFIDVFIIFCIGGNMVSGYKKGLIWSFFGLTSYLVAALCSKLFYLKVADLFRNHTGLVVKIEGFMEKNYLRLFQEGLENAVEVGDGAFKGFGLIGEFLIKDLEIQTYTNQTFEIVKEEIVKGVSTLLLNMISIVVIFIVVKTVILFVGILLNQVFKLPLLNSINRIGGVLIGGMKGIFLVMVTLVAIFVFATLSPNGLMATGIENSLILQIFFIDLFPPFINWLL